MRIQRQKVLLIIACVAVFILLCDCGWRFIREQRARSLDLELSRQTFLLWNIGSRIDKIQSSGGPLPDSVAVFREALEEEMPDIVKRDDEKARVLSRTVLLRDGGIKRDITPY